MSYYAKLGPELADGNQEVIEFHSVDDEHDEGPGKSEATGIAHLMSVFTDTTEDDWKKSSCNTRAGKHIHPDTGEINGKAPLRKNCAAIGMLYDAGRDAFYNPSPYPSWTLQEDTCRWESPAGPRSSGPNQSEERYWNETTLEWVNHTDFTQAIEDGDTTFPDNAG